METEEQSQKWHEESQLFFAHIAQWRKAHPHATMAEIEQAVDEQMQSLRAQVLQDAAQNSPLREGAETTDSEKPLCPDCKVRMQARGQRERHLQTHGGRTVSLKRTYLSPMRVRAFSPWIRGWD